MSFWFKKILYSLRVLPVLFNVIIVLISIRLLLVFTGFIHTHEIIPISSAIAAEKNDKAPPSPQDKNEIKSDSKQETDSKKEPTVPPKKTNKIQDDKHNQQSELSVATDSKEETSDLKDEEEDEFSSQKIELLQKLKDRNDLLLKNEQKLIEKNEILKTVEYKIEEKYKELDQKRLDLEKIKNNLAEINKKIAEEDELKLQRLVKIYQTMKPKDAARIFDKLDMTVLLEVISRMKEGNTAPILANMTAERAQNITMFLAQKRKIAQTE